MSMGRILAPIVIVGVLVGIGFLRGSNRNSARVAGRDDVVTVEKDNARLASATALAQRRWPEFIDAFQKRKKGGSFAVKHGFPVKGGGGTEHMWVEVTSISGETIIGTLVSQPAANVGKKTGDAVNFKASKIDDWMFTDAKGKVTGGFQAKILEEIAGER